MVVLRLSKCILHPLLGYLGYRPREINVSIKMLRRLAWGKKGGRFRPASPEHRAHVFRAKARIRPAAGRFRLVSPNLASPLPQE